MRKMITGSVAVLAAALTIITTTHAQTYVSGGITGRTVWDAASGPWIVTGDVTVGSGDTLVIEPLTEVRMDTTDSLAGGNDATRTEIIVENGGRLEALGGAPGDSIWILGNRPWNDCSYGEWYGIVVETGADIELDLVMICHAQYGFYSIGNASGTVSLNRTRIYDTYNAVRAVNSSERWGIDSCEFLVTAHRGTYLQNVPNFSITNTLIDSCGDHGIYMSGTGMDSNVVIADNVIRNIHAAGDNGIYLDNARPAISGNLMENCYGGIQFNVSSEGYETYHPVAGNAVSGGTNGFTLINYAAPSFSGNNFIGLSGYGVSNGTAGDIDAEGNYWGAAATAEMNAGGNPKDITGIYDRYDNPLRGTVVYSAWLDTVDGNPVHRTQTGVVQFTDGAGTDQFAYAWPGTAYVTLEDADENHDPGVAETVFVGITSTVETSPEMIALIEDDDASGVFKGHILIDSNGTAADDGVIQVVTDDKIMAAYADSATAYGDPDTIRATVLYGVTLVSGAVAGTETWTTATSPYLVTGDIIIGNGDTLVIDPGVKVYFKPKTDDQEYGSNTFRSEIYVEGGGHLRAVGTAADSIILTTKTAVPEVGDWEAVYVNGTGTARMVYCHLSYALYPFRTDATDGSDSVVIRHSRIDNAYRAFYVYNNQQPCRVVIADNRAIKTESFSFYLHSSENVGITGNTVDTSGGVYALSVYNTTQPGTSLTVTGNTFNGNGTITAMYFRNAQAYVFDNTMNHFTTGIRVESPDFQSGPEITYCTFNDCDNGVYCVNDASPVVNYNNLAVANQYGVYNASAYPVNARYNWWGIETTDSMEAGATDIGTIYDSLDNGSYGRVDYSDWLTEELPVEFVSFTASVAGEGVVLCWTTATETDNLGFNVLKSGASDGPFVPVNGALIPGAGTTALPQSYSFTDTDVADGTWYYVLEQVDLGGAVSLSDAVPVDMTGTSGYGVPAASGGAALRPAVLYDLNGAIVPAGTDVPGIYIKVTGGTAVKVFRAE